MKTLVKACARFLKDEEGASAIEYALILGMVALAIITASDTIRTNIVSLYDRIATSVGGMAP